ncbi:MAG: NYN domain-containing protein [Planctomycetes bacterium]|nr:NYN domain-containing protein [Planctomycetota bacterium]
MLLIDGYNLIFAHPRAPDVSRPGALEKARDRLLRLLSEHRAWKSIRITVVFDGRLEPPEDLPRARREYGIDIAFSPKGITADTVIVDTVAKAEHPKSFRIVSSDRAIVTAVRKLGASTTPALEFWGEIETRRAKRQKEVEEEVDPRSHGLTQSETEAWLREFGYDEAGNPVEDE